MKLDVTIKEKQTNTWIFLIDGNEYHEKVYPTPQKAFDAGIAKVAIIRENRQSTTYLTALRFASPEEIIIFDEMNNDQLQKIADRKYL